jgi:hypothetical protein
VGSKYGFEGGIKMSLAYGWLNLDLPEHRQFALSELETLHLENEELPKYKKQCELQKQYIKELEKHVSLLQRTLNMVYKNRAKKKGVKTYRREKNVYSKDY